MIKLVHKDRRGIESKGYLDNKKIIVKKFFNTGQLDVIKEDIKYEKKNFIYRIDRGT